MDALIAGLVVAGVLAVLAIAMGVRAVARSLRDKGRSADDDLRRAGSAEVIDRQSAGNRATGTNAWMRPGGGGI